MRIETISYIPLEPPFVLAEIMHELPAWVISELIQRPRQTYVEVEMHKTHVVDYLDNVFQIGKTYRFRKNEYLEVDQSEIQHFSQFRIVLRAIEWDREVYGNIVRPNCPNDGCSVGSMLLPPIRIPAKTAKKIGIARIHRPWEAGQPSVLVVASWVKKTFEEEGIIGLDYEPYNIEVPESSDMDRLEPLYVAHVKQHLGLFSDAMLRVRYLCEPHGIVSSFEMINRCLYREDFTENDFHIIDHVITKDRVYRLLGPGMVISRRVLQLLLKYKVHGLTNITCFLKEKFIPEVLSDRI